MRGLPFSLLLALVLVAGGAAAAPAGPADAGAPAPSDDDSGGAADLGGGPPAATVPVLNVTQTLYLTRGTPGEVESVLELQVPDNVASATVTIPTDATVLTRTDFSKSGDRTYSWDGNSATPSLRMAVPANETDRVYGPEGADGTLLFADTGEWAIVHRPQIGVSYGYYDQIRVSRHLSVAGEGVAGRAMAYLGPGTVTSRTAHGQTFRLAVPEAATLVESEAAILDSLAAASDILRVGERDDEVLFIAAPTAVPWAVEGLEVGGRDTFVTADERVSSVDNVWLHEYVHTRQNFSLASGTEWLTEASATYYAAALTLEQDRIGFSEFRDYLRRGRDARFDDVVLAKPESWVGGAQYWVGGLVAGETDRRLRVATDGRGTLQAVLRRLNGRVAPVDRATLQAIVADVGTTSVRDALRTFTGTTTRPEVWSRSAHDAAFGTLPARIGVTFPRLSNATAWRATGPYRNANIGGTAMPTLVTGESLVLDVVVTNVGGTGGDFSFRLTRGGTVVAERSGRVAASSTVRVPVTVSFPATGTYRLGLAGSTVDVRVREPAVLDLVDLRAAPGTVAPGRTVTVTATLANRADRPGRRTVEVRRDGTVVATRTAHLPAGERGTVAADVELPTAGEYTITVGNRSVAVRASASATTTAGGATTTTAPGTTTSPTATTIGESGPGLGVGAAALALAALAGALALGRARRRGRP